MSFQELKEQAIKLPADERIALIGAIEKSLNNSEQVKRWEFLVPRPHYWRKQLYIKDSRLPASVIWNDLIVNDMTVKEAAENWDLPIAAIQEALHYCETHRELLNSEIEEENKRLAEIGVIPSA